MLQKEILVGEYNEKVICKQFKFISPFNRLWRRSKNQGILFAAFRGSQSKSGRVQEVGEIQ